MDLVAGWRRGSWDVGATVNNLLDSEWREAQFAEESRVSPTAAVMEDVHVTPGDAAHRAGDGRLHVPGRGGSSEPGWDRARLSRPHSRESPRPPARCHPTAPSAQRWARARCSSASAARSRCSSVVAGRWALRARAALASPTVNPRPRNPSSASDSISGEVTAPLADSTGPGASAGAAAAATLVVTSDAGVGTAAAAGAVQGWAFFFLVRRDCMKSVPKIRSASYWLWA
jgi:hypothetical protein